MYDVENHSIFVCDRRLTNIVQIVELKSESSVQLENIVPVLGAFHQQ